MNRRAAIAVALAALFAANVQRAAASEWDDIVKAAIAEGEVDVHGGPGKLYEQVLSTVSAAPFRISRSTSSA